MLSSSFISMQLVTQVVNLNWTSLYTDKKSEKEIALCRLSLTQGELENFVYLYKSQAVLEVFMIWFSWK